jgi:hypothetical protein
MLTTKQGYALLAVALAAGLGGFALGQLQPKPAIALAADNAAPPKVEDAKVIPPRVEDAKPAKAEDKPAPGRRREAVIKMPVGTFVKDMDVGMYGSGRLTWTFEDDKVHGTIEAGVMGVEVELQTEAEISLSSNGTIYGIVTGVELVHVKVAAGGELGELGEYAKFAKLAEPLINETLTDLPFSYQFRIRGDKLTILNYRMLLAGPNPLGKLGGVLAGEEGGFGVLSYFQAISIAVEGTYTASEAEPRDKPKAKPILRKPMAKK